MLRFYVSYMCLDSDTKPTLVSAHPKKKTLGVRGRCPQTVIQLPQNPLEGNCLIAKIICLSSSRYIFSLRYPMLQRST